MTLCMRCGRQALSSGILLRHFRACYTPGIVNVYDRRSLLDRARRWLNPYPDTPGALRLSFVAAYIGVVGSLVTYLNFATPCSTTLPPARQWFMIGLLATMLFIERFELAQDPLPGSRRRAVALLILRVVLVQGVVMLDCTGMAVLLWAVVPFAVYFTLGAGVSHVIGLGYWCLVALRAWRVVEAGLSLDSITMVVIFTLLLIFVHLIAGHIDRDQRSRQEMRRLLGQLEASHRQLQTYADRVAELAAAAERNRLARDMHDNLGHYLTAISIQLEKAQAYRDRNSDEADRAISDAKESARAALRAVRQSVSALRESEDRFSLRQSLEGLVNRMDGGPIEIAWRFDGDETGYPGAVLVALYRAAQEGLTNVQKHAQARHVQLQIDLGEGAARLCLRDDGVGFDADSLAEHAGSPGQGYGLQGIQERIDLVKGEMRISSDVHSGTELSIVIPKRLEEVAAT